jgi:hypothetical protein
VSDKSIITSGTRDGYKTCPAPDHTGAVHPRTRGSLILMAETQGICPCARPWKDCPRVDLDDLSSPRLPPPRWL